MMLLRIIASLIALGVMSAGVILWRIIAARQVRWIRQMRWFVAALAAYGTSSFIYSAVTGVSVRDAFNGRGLLQALPFVFQGAFIGGFVILPLGWIAAVIRVGLARFRERAPRPIWFQAVALTTCLALLISSLELRVGEKHLAPQERIALLDKSLRALADGDREMPRDTWDPDYVVSMLGRDPQRLFRWVRNNTFWIPYHGVLRGAVGVLMDRQGNSLDRAILLATLLERAGQTVRLAHGELTPEQVKALLPKVVAMRELAFHQKPGDDISKPAKLERVSAQYGFERGSMGEVLSNAQHELAELSAEVRARAKDQSERLLRVVNRATAETEWAERFNSALAALTDHWWVQQLQNGKWIDRDLLQESSKNGAALAALQTTTAIADLAADLRHQIIVRLVCEQAAHGKLTEHTTLEQAVPLAELKEQPVVLKFWPADWISDAGQAEMPSNDFRRAVLAQEKWVAALAVDRKLVAAGLVLANGDDPKAPRKGGSMGGLADAFSSTMKVRLKDENRQLSAVWIEYEFRVPGEKPRTVRRNVFDLIGPAKRSSSNTAIELSEPKRLTRGLAMLMRTEILPISCRFSPEFLTHLGSQTLIGNQAIIKSAIQGDFNPGTPSSEALLEHMAPLVSRLYSLAEARIEWANDPDSMFISEPQLLTSHSYAVPKGDHIVFKDATDIVANKFGVSLGVPDGFVVRLKQGVLDTNVESQVQLGTHTLANVADVYATSGSWAHVADAAQVKALKLTSDSLQQITEDVSSGYDVVAPQTSSPIFDGDFVGWWRIDRTSGAALGMGANGWGQATTEEETTNVPAVEQEPRFIRMMNAAKEGFLGGYSFCVAIRTWKTVDADKAVIHRHLIATIGSPDTQRECLVEGIVSAVLSLFIVTIGPVLSKWMTRTFPLAARAGRWLAGGGKPILGGNGGGPPGPVLASGAGANEPTGGGAGHEPGGGGEPGGGKGSGGRNSGRGPGGGPNEPGSPSERNADPGSQPDDSPCDDLQSAVAQQDDLVFQSSEGRLKAPFDSMEQIDQKLKDLGPAKQQAEEFRDTAAEAVQRAENQLDLAAKDYQRARDAAVERLGEEDYYNDPAATQARNRMSEAETTLGNARQVLFDAEKDLSKLAAQENHFRAIQAPTARLLQAEQQLDLSLQQGMKLRQALASAANSSAACGGGSSLSSEAAAFEKEASAINAEYRAALNDYMDAFFDEGLPYESAPTQVDPSGRVASTTTQPGYPNGSHGTPGVGPGQAPALPSQPQAPTNQGQVSSPGQQSSAANSIPPNPMANSVVGVEGVFNALGGGAK